MSANNSGARHHTLTVFFLSDDERYAARLDGVLDELEDEDRLAMVARAVLAQMNAR